MFFINPFIYGGAGGDFESIATVTVGSGGASSIEFTSIPGTYQHLQIRGLLRNTASGAAAPTRVRINADTTASNYARHDLDGNGSIAYAQGGASTNFTAFGEVAGGGLSNAFCANVIDILDYGTTTKNKTLRFFSGYELNGSGAVAIQSILWLNTGAITSLALVPWEGNFAQHSTLALYGIKAP